MAGFTINMGRALMQCSSLQVATLFDVVHGSPVLSQILGASICVLILLISMLLP